MQIRNITLGSQRTDFVESHYPTGLDRFFLGTAQNQTSRQTLLEQMISMMIYESFESFQTESERRDKDEPSVDETSRTKPFNSALLDPIEKLIREL